MKLKPWRRRTDKPALRTTPWNRELEDFLGNLWERPKPFEMHLPEVFTAAKTPPVNLAESEHKYTISVELPGLSEEEIDLRFVGNHLEISGERKWSNEDEEKEFHYVETQFGSFFRSVPLPDGVLTDPDSVDATYEQGMLTVSIPKVEPTPAKKIPVHTG